MPFTSDNAYSMRARGGGLARARFWRSLGFPNLVRAREAKKRYAERRKQEAAKVKAQYQLRKALESTGDW
jgi:hypothetical protein